MPLHFNDADLSTEVSGIKSALIVPCIMCPSVTVSIREKQPLMKLYRSIFKSAPFEQYLKTLQTRLGDRGVKADIFKSRLYQHWFLCMWSSARRKKLQRHAQRYEAVIVLGCDSATKTVRDAIQSPDCSVIEGMKVGGLTNAKNEDQFPGQHLFRGRENRSIASAMNGAGADGLNPARGKYYPKDCHRAVGFFAPEKSPSWPN